MPRKTPPRAPSEPQELANGRRALRDQLALRYMEILLPSMEQRGRTPRQAALWARTYADQMVDVLDEEITTQEP